MKLTIAVILYSENDISFDQAKNIYINLSSEKGKIGKCVINKTENCFGLLLGIFQYDFTSKNWYFTALMEPFKAGDIYVSTKSIQKLLIKYSFDSSLNRLEFDNKKSKHPFFGKILYKKNDWVKIRSNFIYIGLGLIINSNYNLKFNASIFTYDNSNNLIDTINSVKMSNKNQSILIYDEGNKSKIHQAKTDDVLLSIDFDKLDKKISILTITINCYPLDTFFNKAYDVYIRLFDKLGPDGIHAISKFGINDNLIIMGQFRKVNDTWYFEPIGQVGCVFHEKDIPVNSLSFIKKNPFKLINSS